MKTGLLRGALGLSLALALLGTVGAASAFASLVDTDRTNNEYFIVVFGDGDADDVTVSTTDTTVTITDTGPGGISSISGLCMNASPTSVECPRVSPEGVPVSEFDAILQGGNDRFVNQNLVTYDLFIDGPGNDTAEMGPSASEVEDGPGDDNYHGGAGDDFLELRIGGTEVNGADVADGGPGDDEADYFPTIDPVTMSLNQTADDGRAGEGDNLLSTESLDGGLGDDNIVGDDGPNFLWGRNGNDTLSGLGGDDSLNGDYGDDIHIGGPGADAISCVTGVDVAILDPFDNVFACERTGAVAKGDTAKVRKNQAKVKLVCDATEVDRCAGKLRLLHNDKEIGKTVSYDVLPGSEVKAVVKLTKGGKRKLRKANGQLPVTVQTQSDLPGGTSVREHELELTGKVKAKKEKK